MGLVCTGPQGIISCTSPEGIKYQIGRARNIQVRSDFQRDFVQGIGTVGAKETPVTAWRGTVSVEKYAVLTTAGLLHAYDLSEQDSEKLFNYLLFESGVDLMITSKRKVDGQIIEVPVISLTRLFITEESWTFAENAIWGNSGQFNLLDPPSILGSQLPDSVRDNG